jgi:hypothetical protein
MQSGEHYSDSPFRHFNSYMPAFVPAQKIAQPVTAADWMRRGGADAVSLGGQPLCYVKNLNHNALEIIWP